MKTQWLVVWKRRCVKGPGSLVGLAYDLSDVELVHGDMPDKGRVLGQAGYGAIAWLRFRQKVPQR